jgi:hypothetical protein
MSVLADPLRRSWVPNIASTRADAGYAIKDWIATGRYYVDSVTSGEEFVLQVSAVEDIAPLFASSSNRMISSCFESIISISEVSKSPRSLAWLVMTLYYASFFSAHAHLRMCGKSCSQLDAVDMTRLFSAAQAYGLTGTLKKFSRGFYFISFDLLTLKLSFKKSAGEGSHEFMWEKYDEHISELETSLPNILIIPSQLAKAQGSLTAFRFNICRNNNKGSWLSFIRNGVNYRHEHGVWYPYGLKKSVPSGIFKELYGRFSGEPEDVPLDSTPIKPGSEIVTFSNTALFCCSLAYSMAKDASQRSTDANSAFMKGSVAFLKMSKSL